MVNVEGCQTVTNYQLTEGMGWGGVGWGFQVEISTSPRSTDREQVMMTSSPRARARAGVKKTLLPASSDLTNVTPPPHYLCTPNDAHLKSRSRK